MSRDFSRAERVADQLQRNLSELIRLEVKDPRVSLVTVTSVEVSRDLSYAKVYVTSLAQAHTAQETVLGLQRAAGFLRSQLARGMKLRTVPQLQFVYDTSVERGIRLSTLIDEAIADSDSHQTDDDSS
jgi:ribosome-binding factor A